jgi:hypothetical protein
VLLVLGAAMLFGCTDGNASASTKLGGGAFATIVRLPPAPHGDDVFGVWLVRQGDVVLWGASTHFGRGTGLPRPGADFVARSVDFGRHWSWERAARTAPSHTAKACDVLDCQPVQLSPARAFRVQNDGEDYVLTYVNWTNDSWNHDSYRHVDMGCPQKRGVRETLWTPALIARNDILLLGACGDHGELRSMRVVRTTAELDHFDVVKVGRGDVLPGTWPVGPVAVPHGLLSVFTDRHQRPVALIVTDHVA